MPLFLRNGRGVSLTPTGQRLYEQIEPAMRTLADAVASVQAHASPRGVLRLRTVSTLSMLAGAAPAPSMRACQACA